MDSDESSSTARSVAVSASICEAEPDGAGTDRFLTCFLTCLLIGVAEVGSGDVDDAVLLDVASVSSWGGAAASAGSLGTAVKASFSADPAAGFEGFSTAGRDTTWAKDIAVDA